MSVISACLILPVLTTCTTPPTTHHPPQLTFYYWQTRLAPDTTARALLAENDCDRLYVKAFDVVWQAGRAEPTALLQLADTADLPTLAPVVFVTNEVMASHPRYLLDSLAGDVLALTEVVLGPDFPELQIDCDWTAGTRVNYFVFLKALRARLGERALTCTIRLHQYRDAAAQGVPPVNRATLMAYNVGSLNRWETDNSIVDTVILKTYLAGAAPYPLDLDLAVAVYDWAAVYRRGNLAYLINEPPLKELADTSRFRPLPGGLRYEVARSTYLDGTYLYAGDRLRREIAPVELVAAQAELLRRYVPGFAEQRLMVYRLGSRLWGN